MSKRLGVKKIFTTAYHPQTNGQVGRLNRYIATALPAYVQDHQQDWDEHLKAIALAYRTSAIEAIGDTPFHLVHGRNPRLPTTVLFGREKECQRDAHDFGLHITKDMQEAYQSTRAHQSQADAKRKEAYDSCHKDISFA